MQNTRSQNSEMIFEYILLKSPTQMMIKIEPPVQNITTYIDQLTTQTNSVDKSEMEKVYMKRNYHDSNQCLFPCACVLFSSYLHYDMINLQVPSSQSPEKSQRYQSQTCGGGAVVAARRHGMAARRPRLVLRDHTRKTATCFTKFPPTQVASTLGLARCVVLWMICTMPRTTDHLCQNVNFCYR